MSVTAIGPDRRKFKQNRLACDWRPEQVAARLDCSVSSVLSCE
jgi:hypothetical protein